jgi:hypothetical protein
MGLDLPSLRPQQDSEPPEPPPESEPATTSKLIREVNDLRDRNRRYQAILEEKRLRSIAPPPPPRGHTIPQWAAVLVAVITAVGATGGWEAIKSIREKPTARPEELTRVENECKEKFDDLASYLAGYAEDQTRRDNAQNTVLCQLNNGPIAGRLECRDDACEQPALNNGKIVPGQPICKAKTAWPKRRQPPKPTEPTEEE